MAERILVVDDEEEIRLNLKEYLSELKYEIFLADSGKAAQEVLQEKKMDLVLMDLMLPDGSGLDFLAWIKENPKTYSVPVIILSAKSDSSTKALAFARGADDFITKPYNLMEVTARVRNVISRSIEKHTLNPLIHSLSDWYDEGGITNLKEQLEISSQIQKTLLPRTFPEVEGFDIAARIHPAQLIGGDFYDFFRLTPQKHLMLLGDVTGRGIPAAIMMVITRSFLRLSKIWCDLSPMTVVNRLNQLLVQDIPSDMFVTLFYIVLDREKNTISIVSTGGLTQPYHYSLADGKGDYLENVHGAMVGMFDDQEMELNTIAFAKGDTFIFFTDGLISTLNERGEVYSQKNLRQCIEKNIHLPARDICQRILEDVLNFAEDKNIEDDLALMVMKRPGAVEAAKDAP